MITREQAARAALDIIDEQGLDALNLKAVAKRLGIQAPSLYNHVRDRADLLNLVARMIISEPLARLDDSLPGGDPTQDWRDYLVERCVVVRSTLLAHPNAAPLVVGVLPRHVLTDGYERTAQVCEANNLPPSMILVVLQGIESMSFGATIFTASAVVQRKTEDPSFDADEYPSYARALDANRMSPEHLFRASVRAFLDGVANTSAGSPNGRPRSATSPATKPAARRTRSRAS